jgi:hypothetical protein
MNGQVQSLFDTIIEKAEEPMVADGEEETYNAGYQDGAIAFARELAKHMGVTITIRKTEEESDEG